MADLQRTVPYDHALEQELQDGRRSANVPLEPVADAFAEARQVAEDSLGAHALVPDRALRLLGQGRPPLGGQLVPAGASSAREDDPAW